MFVHFPVIELQFWDFTNMYTYIHNLINLTLFVAVFEMFRTVPLEFILMKAVFMSVSIFRPVLVILSPLPNVIQEVN